MALTPFQRDICRLLADHRIRSGESYVAGGAALNEVLRASRVSRDLDLFHDTEEALEAAWQADRASLEATGYRLSVLRERGGVTPAPSGERSLESYAEPPQARKRTASRVCWTMRRYSAESR